ncbi:hypothetical protein CO015_01270 [candidate division WWE3 bacterium CG_4_8_14_3_um_filter_42_11]|uniref:Uncharacterized protein n=1 Tax=candidate division WWE3 bacterium CG_4_8_14_3_um_filter_42_11 TaxID=1975076 RepID=A0A2M8G7N2_UNCKA|nr:MAG: hypothetical protein AUJ38_00145 [bacterium CG1_02_42_9]PJC69182.1 MAG: hypothetical protein CO015_01270 [candidate division WWE3 bacterium CG_4_8_14_3_um_filter_42_11]
MIRGLKRFAKKIFLWIIFPVLAVVLFFAISGQSLPNFSDLGFGNVSDSVKGLTQSSLTASEVLNSASQFLHQKIRIEGKVHYTFRNPDYLGTFYYLDQLPLKIDSGKTQIWQSAVGQTKSVEGVLEVKTVSNPAFGGSTDLYYLENPVLID